MKKQNFLKITKGYVIITIHFGTLKIATLKYLEKAQKHVIFRVGHRELKKSFRIRIPCCLKWYKMNFFRNEWMNFEILTCFIYLK